MLGTGQKIQIFAQACPACNVQPSSETKPLVAIPVDNWPCQQGPTPSGVGEPGGQGPQGLNPPVGQSMRLNLQNLLFVHFSGSCCGVWRYLLLAGLVVAMAWATATARWHVWMLPPGVLDATLTHLDDALPRRPRVSDRRAGILEFAWQRQPKLQLFLGAAWVKSRLESTERCYRRRFLRAWLAHPLPAC